ncbi:hypothetical protein V495_08081, partial [Pseudogymnoascus sp. VKM F-4514 (FW-929)]
GNIGVMEDWEGTVDMGETDGMVGDDTDVSSEYEGDNTGLQSPRGIYVEGKPWLPRGTIDRPEWKDDACKRPVLRMASTNGVDKTRALTFAALWDQIVSLGRRVGYRDNVKVHAIRANVANNVKDPETRNQDLGHRSKEIHSRHYASKIIDVSAYIPGTSSAKNIEMLRSMNHRRDRHAPRDLPCKEKDEFYRRPEVQELNKSITEATAKLGDKPDKNSAQFKERQKLYAKKGTLLRSARESFREEWFSASFDKEALRQLQEEDDDDDETN